MDNNIKVKASGRINFIGEHVDYVNGCSIPASINLGNTVKVSFQKKNNFTFNSYPLAKKAGIGCKELFKLGTKGIRKQWFGYMAAPLLVLQDYGFVINHGLNIVVRSDLPLSAGLSSSASIILGVLYGICSLHKLEFSGYELALMAKETENKYLGAPCGFLDQLAISFGQKNTLLYLDYTKNTVEKIPFQTNSRIYIINSMIKHSISGEGYAQRIKEKEQIENYFERNGLISVREFAKSLIGNEIFEKTRERLFELWFFLKNYYKNLVNRNDGSGVDNLQKNMAAYLPVKDINTILQEFFTDCCRELPFTLKKRLFHYITEIERVLLFKLHCEEQKIEKAFQLLWITHLSLSLFYEVSVPEIDRIILYLSLIDSVKGARIMGGGFGGSIIAVSEGPIDKKLEELKKKCRKWRQPEIKYYPITLDQGLSILS